MSDPKILLVEDELSLAEGIKLNLELEGLACTWIPRGDQALKEILAVAYDLVILDVMLPGLDGYTICERVRAAKNFTPILFLTAKNTDDDRVHGFETGADDYLGKPFQVRELLLRVRAILRRESWYKSREINSRQPFGAYWVDFDNFCGEGPSGTFQLGVKESMILKLLMERPGQVVSRTDILDKVWGEDAYPTSRTVDNFIVRFRKYFEDNPQEPRYFKSLRSIGYVFDHD